MNFKVVLETLLKRFVGQNIDFVLIGGFAVGAAGFSRATQDIDFMVRLEDADRINKIMTDLDYKLLQKSSEFALYASDIEVFGRVDFLFAHRERTLKMMQRASEKSIMGGKTKVKVLSAEDIIGLKVQSMANNPKRASKDLVDIENILLANKEKLDMDLIREYFSLFGKEKDLIHILERIQDA